MSNYVRMMVYDVQHGLAVHVQAPNGKYIVIDLGAGKYGKNEPFSPLELRRYDDIAYMIITHPHLDHIDDILNFDKNPPSILNRPVEISNYEIMSKADLNSYEKFRKYCEVNDRYSLPLSDDDENNPNSIDNYGGLEIKRFRDIREDNNFNNHSCVVIFKYLGVKIVVCGDNEVSNLDNLMEQTDFNDAIVDADVLVVPHHGRESGFNLDFVKLVNPRISIVSDGRRVDTSANDRYSKYSRGWDVLDEYKNVRERKCLTTNNDGTIEVEISPSSNPQYCAVLSVSIEK